MAEFNHGIGLRELTDRYLPKPGSNRGFNPSVFVESLVLMLQGGGRSLEDIRELKNEEGLMRLIDNEKIPDPDSVGNGDASRSGKKDMDKGEELVRKEIVRLNQR